MENTFPAALVERIKAMNVPGITAEFVQIGDVRMAEGCGYDVIVDRISHDIPFYRAWLKNSALCGAKVINNPFWWSADDKFFNYALATKLGRGGSADGAAAAQGTSDRHDRAVDAQPALPARLGIDLRVRRLPGVPEAVRRRRLARRLQDQQPRGVLQRLRSDAHALHDAAARGELQGILPLLRRRAGAGAHHALRSARAVPRALRAESAGVSDGAAGAREAATRKRCAARSATTSTPWSSPARTASRTRSTS